MPFGPRFDSIPKPLFLCPGPRRGSLNGRDRPQGLSLPMYSCPIIVLMRVPLLVWLPLRGQPGLWRSGFLPREAGPASSHLNVQATLPGSVMQEYL